MLSLKKKQCTVEVLNKSVKKMTLVDFDYIKQTSVFTCMVHVGQFHGM